jgi:hypothetical protein
LDPDSRIQLAAATALDPFPAPRLSPEREAQVLAQVHEDREYAARVHHWIASGRAG